MHAYKIRCDYNQYGNFSWLQHAIRSLPFAQSILVQKQSCPNVQIPIFPVEDIPGFIHSSWFSAREGKYNNQKSYHKIKLGSLHKCNKFWKFLYRHQVASMVLQNILNRSNMCAWFFERSAVGQNRYLNGK